MHEGNIPRLQPGDVGMVLDMLGDENDDYPLVFLLLQDRQYGVFGKYLEFAQLSQ